MLQLLYIIGIILALLWCVCWCGTKYTDHQQRKKEREMFSPANINVDLEELEYQPKILSFKKAMGDITSV